MELTGVELQIYPRPDGSPGGKTLHFPLYAITPTTKYILKRAEGFSDADQSIILGDAYGASTFLQHMSANPKDIVLKIGLNPDYISGETPGALRRELHSYMGGIASRPVLVRAVGESRSMTIEGYISKIESDIFSESTDVFVTVKCSTPFFIDTRQIVTSPVNDYITGSFNINPQGTAFNTFIFEILPDQNAPYDMTISASTVPDTLHLVSTSALFDPLTSDTIHVRTVFSDPQITRRINGSPFENDWENLVNYLTYDSKFFVLPPGPATITIDLPHSYQLKSLILVEYYWGV